MVYDEGRKIYFGLPLRSFRKVRIPSEFEPVNWLRTSCLRALTVSEVVPPYVAIKGQACEEKIIANVLHDMLNAVVYRDEAFEYNQRVSARQVNRATQTGNIATSKNTEFVTATMQQLSFSLLEPIPSHITRKCSSSSDRFQWTFLCDSRAWRQINYT